MIVRMKKLTFLVYYKQYQEFLEEIRDRGVIHVIENRQGALDDAHLQEQMSLLSRYTTVIAELERLASKTPEPAADDADCPSLLTEWAQLQADKTETEAQLQNLLKNEQTLAPWGDFDPNAIDRLEQQGYKLNFFACPLRSYKTEWESDYNAIIIASDKNRHCFITITKPEVELAIEAELCRLPHVSLTELQRNIDDCRVRLTDIETRMSAFANGHIASLRAAKAAMQSDIDFSKVALSADAVADNKVMLLQGWAPEKCLPDLCAYLDKSAYYYRVDDPTPEDDIPIQLSNNKFFRLFEPLTKLYMLPKYGELDLTMFFAPFFMLFFGLCLGDMGYGLLIMLALPVFTKLFQLINPDFKPALVFLFGLSTLVFGSLTGSAFGFSLYDIDLPFFQKMKDLLYQDNQSMFYLSLIIGCVQILFAMCLKVVNLSIQLGFKYAVSTIGWIILLVTLAVGVLTSSTGATWFLVLMIIAGCMIFLYNSPGKNIFLNIGLGLWDTYNMITGLLGDVLSYVRLFALGLSGGILASVFNSLAEGMSPKIPVLGFLVMAIIFVLGHALNIFMNVLGSMVHPMRLTFVEFFKNAGYEGGGTEYKPFKK